VTSLGDRLRDLLLGARAGLVATALMSLLMLAAKAAGLTGRLPPATITDTAMAKLPSPRQPDRDERDAIAAAVHFGFGTAAGAIFGLTAAGVRRIWLSTALGVLYATVVYAVSDLGWIPALNLMPPATRDRPGRSVTMLVAHWVYGATLGGVLALGQQRRDVAQSVKRRFA
jgi:hypothetical protein